MECKYGSTDFNFRPFLGINRYIMECKSTTTSLTVPSFSELIDTLWNVNEVVRIRCDLSTLELIDTLWNVN